LDNENNNDTKRLNPTAMTSITRWKQRCFLLAIAWLTSIVLMSIPAVRAIAIQPLCIHHPDAAGEVAYVMADGHAYWERLRAASDLYNEKQVARVMILDESEPAGFNYHKSEVDSRAQRAIDHLELFGVPNDRVSSIPINTETSFGSLNEARGFKKHYPELKRLVVVTSAPHTRRSLLCFQRTLPKSTNVQIYSASPPVDSAELTAPIWMEYAKLLVYYFVA
jgi:hypothetical protein